MGYETILTPLMNWSQRIIAKPFYYLRVIRYALAVLAIDIALTRPDKSYLQHMFQQHGILLWNLLTISTILAVCSTVLWLVTWVNQRLRIKSNGGRAWNIHKSAMHRALRREWFRETVKWNVLLGLMVIGEIGVTVSMLFRIILMMSLVIGCWLWLIEISEDIFPHYRAPESRSIYVCEKDQGIFLGYNTKQAACIMCRDYLVDAGLSNYPPSTTNYHYRSQPCANILQTAVSVETYEALKRGGAQQSLQAYQVEAEMGIQEAAAGKRD